MSAGRARAFDQLFMLEAFDAQQDGGGGVEGAWRVLGRHWGRLEPVSATERNLGEARRSEVTHRLSLCWRAEGAPSRPRPEQRFRRGTRVFGITGVGDADGARRELICWVREGVRE